ncbi:Mur ligase family protein [Candidatus Poriferisodalis sp.]|uniref:Mur ligase family protein n=1 Tax=Candidatus Poriferisodalis sp. TaxID=3101277 RepID=UPI003B01BFAF
MNQIVLWSSVAAGALGACRWLRVAQREHYGIGRASRFARRWWLLGWHNRSLSLLAVAGVVLSGAFWWAPALTAAAVAAGPHGLGLRGRTGPLAWTRRLATVATTLAVLWAVLVGVGLLVGLASPVVAVLLFGMPLWVDASLALLAPFEAVLSRRWVRRARQRLDHVDPVRVAVTGSYGKTTIKGYLRQLLEDSRSVVATPASFNNTAGICRTVNEHLAAGTEVFIAEMGTFAAGEIAAMTRWVRPSVSILASIGPVHLERFGSLERIVAAKTEIFATSRTAILNVDAYGLAAEADRLAASGLRVIRCSARDPSADVTVLAAGTEPAARAATAEAQLLLDNCDGPDDGGLDDRSGSHMHTPAAATDEAAGTAPRVTLFGRTIAAVPLGDAAPENVACAVAAASVLGVSDADIAGRLAGLSAPEHRRTAVRSPSGVMVIDDTYNSNPAGARAALSMLSSTEAERRVVVTPGMVELGRTQASENRRFGELAARVADDVLIVGRTNRTALLGGAASWDAATARRATRGRSARSLVHDRSTERATIRCMEDREAAVRWVRKHLGDGDAVLYENDLPDHYP